MNHYMIDIETLGKPPKGVIIQIGAVEFDPYAKGGRSPILDSFSLWVDPVSCEKIGMECHASTILWWAKTGLPDGLKEETLVPIESALSALSTFFLNGKSSVENRIVWAKSPVFDLAILSYAMKKLNVPPLWKYQSELDVRTLQNLSLETCEIADEVYSKNVGVIHNALDDAIIQARVVNKIYSKLNL